MLASVVPSDAQHYMIHVTHTVQHLMAWPTTDQQAAGSRLAQCSIVSALLLKDQLLVLLKIPSLCYGKHTCSPLPYEWA